MRRENVKKSMLGFVVLSELGHLFCCVLPVLFSLIGIIAGFGVIPSWIISTHDAMHHYELAIIVFSGVMLTLGWAAYWYSQRIDCHDTGCHHPPCDKKKDWNKLVLQIAVVLFVFNLLIYAGVHRGLDVSPYSIEHE